MRGASGAEASATSSQSEPWNLELEGRLERAVAGIPERRYRVAIFVLEVVYRLARMSMFEYIGYLIYFPDNSLSFNPF